MLHWESNCSLKTGRALAVCGRYARRLSEKKPPELPQVCSL